MKTQILLLLALASCLLLVSNIYFIAGAEFDNVVNQIDYTKDIPITIGTEAKLIEYKPIWEKYAPLRIENIFGLGKTLAQLALEEHTETCGSNCYSTFDICTYNDGVLIDDIKFVGGDVDYKFLLETGSLVDKYEYGCKYTGTYAPNGSALYNCSNYIIGKEKEIVEYKLGEIYKAGCYKIELEGIKEKAKTVDWQITTQGKLLSSWAVWGGSGPAQIYLISPDDSSSYLVKPINFTCLATITPGVNNATNTCGTQTGAGTSAEKRGVKFYVQENLTVTSIKAMTSADARSCYLYSADSATNYTTGSWGEVGVWGKKWCNITYNLEKGKEYIISSDANGLVAGVAYNTGAFPRNLTYIAFTSGITGGGVADNSNSWNIEAINITIPGSTANLVNISFWTNQTGLWKINQTLTTGATQSSYKNFTNKLFDVGNWLWTCSACDTEGNCGQSAGNRTFKVDYLTFNSYSFNASVYEMMEDMNIVNITYDTSATTSISAFLVWNGSSYSATKEGSGNTVLFKKTLNIPADYGNKSFFWQINFYTGDGFAQINSTAKYQNVLPINFTLCNYSGIMNVTFLNYTVKDEETGAFVNPFTFAGTFFYYLGDETSYRNYSILNNSVSSGLGMPFCVNPPNLNMKVRGLITYGDNNSLYVTRNYEFPETIIGNSSTSNILYLLKSDDSTTFIQKVVDTVQTAQPDVYIYTDRYNAGTNGYDLVQVTKTGDDGKTVGFYKAETVIYRHRLYDSDNNLLLQTSPGVVFAESTPYTLTFTIGSTEEVPWQDLEVLSNLWSDIAWNNNTQISNFSYIDTSGSFTSSRFYIEKVYWNQSNVMVCNTTSTLSSAIINCNLANYNGSMIAKGYITRGNTETLVELYIFDATPLRGKDILGRGGLFLAWFIMLVAGTIFLYNFVAGMWIEVAAIFFINMIGLASFPAVFMWGALAVALITTVIMNKSSGGLG